MNKKIKIFVIIFILFFSFIISSCKHEYIVTFKDFDGSILKEQIVKKTNSAIAPNTPPSREGYNFIGWSEDFTNVKNDIIVIAQYEKIINTYKVTFKGFDGNVLKEEIVQELNSATAPNAPIIEGYNFIGWSEDFTNVKNDIIVIAQYEKIINTYKVTFKGIDGNVLKEEIVQELNSATAPNAPIIEGYNFIGWSEDFTNVKNDIIVIAQYEKIKHVVSFSTGCDTIIDNQYIENGEKVYEPSIPIKKGYNFIGWYYKNERWEFDTHTIEEDITLNAKWNPLTYNIFYTLNGGVVENPSNYTIEDNIILNNPIKDGYEFIGWTTSENSMLSLNVTINSEIGDKYFIANWTNVKLELNSENEYIVTGMLNKIHTEAIIPNYYNGIKVTGIAENAFSDCTNLTKIEIPSNITYIGEKAFLNCTALKYIKIPYNVNKMGRDVFYNCKGLTIYCEIPYRPSSWEIDDITVQVAGTISQSYYWGINEENLVEIDNILYYLNANYQTASVSKFIGNDKEIEIPEKITHNNIEYDVKYIENYAFFNSSCITNLIMSASINSIGKYAFYNCTNLLEIEIPYGIKKIDYGIFYGCSSLKQVGIPDTVTTIYDLAFYNCSSLTSITIPEGVTSIGNDAFYNCSNLTSITIPEGVTNIGRYAFSSCSSLTSITIPKGVTSIGRYAFSSCSSLTSITIPEGVISIGIWAFYNCSSLTSITILEGVTSIGASAFSGCSSLTSIYYKGTIEEWCNISFADIDSNPMVYATHFYMLDENNEWYEVTSINIPNTIIAIGQYQFYGFDNITSITIPEGVISIGIWAFYNCSSLTSITILEGVTSIGASAFSGCSSLTSITIPEGVTSIGASAFSGCSSLTSITIPEGVTSIGSAAFYSCSSLTSITIPEGVTSIGNYAFSGCSSLTSITILEGVTSIGNDAFYNCSSLTSITIPEGVTSIGSYAFYRCSSLTSIYYKGTIENWCSIIFSSSVSNPMKYAKHFFMLDENNEWYEVTSINIPNTIIAIGQYQFCGFDNITSITIPEGVTSIGSYAFYRCSNLISIRIPESVVDMGKSVFEICPNLTIYCKHAIQPNSWNENWNNSDRPVYWGINEDNFVEIDECNI